MPKWNIPLSFLSHLLVMARPECLSQISCLHWSCKNKNLNWVRCKRSHLTAWGDVGYCRARHANHSFVSYLWHRSESPDLHAQLCQDTALETNRWSSFPVQVCGYVLCAVPDQWRLRIQGSNCTKFEDETCPINWRLPSLAIIGTFDISNPLKTWRWLPMRAH